MGRASDHSAYFHAQIKQLIVLYMKLKKGPLRQVVIMFVNAVPTAPLQTMLFFDSPIIFGVVSTPPAINNV
jgi:hypothetical protein